MQQLFNSLKANISGEVYFDTIHKKVYSVDASIYEIEPIGVVLPKCLEDLIQVVKIAKSYHVPIIARGAATGITGGCLGRALIVDTSKFLNHIQEINFEHEYAICQPGVVQDRLNEALASQGYRLGPDTSTGNRATLGGMLANNAAGAHSLLYGKMVDHVEAVELLLMSGQLITFGRVDEETLQQKCLQSDEEGHIYREICRLRKEYQGDIERHFPKLSRRVSGYNLDELIKAAPLNVAKLIAGSEGSLGVITQIKVKISKKLRFTGLSIVHCENMEEGLRALGEMLAFQPISLEMIDHHIIAAGQLSPSMHGKFDWLRGKPQVVFIVELEAASKEMVVERQSFFSASMHKHKIGYACVSLTEPSKMNDVWDVRKAGLGLLLSKRTYSRAIAFLEDVTVSPEQLPSFMDKFCRYLANIGKTAGIYGHVGAGCMHIRPYINLKQADDLVLMEKMMEDISDLLLEHGGALSGEHGDGLVRSWLNKKMFGDRLYQAFIELKTAFDPHNLMNPGKVVHGRPFLENLRLSPHTKQVKIDTFLDFSLEGGIELAADLCNGNGLCRKAEKIMCPSFQATGDEYHSTRARAQALRAVINGRLPIQDFTSHQMYDVLDLCLECKGCKSECPSEVDMAKMKAEFLYQYQERYGYSWRSRLFANIGKLNALSSLLPNFFNRLVQNKLVKVFLNLFGITKQRDLPLLAQKRFSVWYEQNKVDPLKSDQSKKQVVLYNDTYTEFNSPEIGKSALKVLTALGYEVIVPKWHCCGRPAISKGFLPEAQKMAELVVSSLLPYAQKGLQIIGLEPSCLFAIKDDYMGLLGKSKREDAAIISAACISLDDFLFSHLSAGKLPLQFKEEAYAILLHGHCHQKALVGMKNTVAVLKAIPGFQVAEIDSGCCGLAGSFGYEKEHYAISMKIGELRLFPAIRKSLPTAVIVANGISCRSQIQHGTARPSKHLAEVIAEALL